VLELVHDIFLLLSVVLEHGGVSISSTVLISRCCVLWHDRLQ
jgi:hypothetical protein